MNKLLALLLLGWLSHDLAAQNYADSLTFHLTQHAKQSGLPGFSVAVVDETGVLYQHGFGYANKTAQTPFESTTTQNLGSVSKTVVGLALVKAIEEGKLTLDTPINEVLPFPISNPYHKEVPILVRHLATHTSGILDTRYYSHSYVEDTSVENEGELEEGFHEHIRSHEVRELKDYLYRILHVDGEWYKKKNFLKGKPGEVREYSNLGAALTAYVIELATETPFEEFTQTHIFSPLGMVYTAWRINEKNKAMLATPYFPAGKVVPRYKLITYPDGGLISNAKDLSLYLAEMIKAYAGNSSYLPETYAQMMLPGDTDENRAFWGMGVKSRNIGHGGSDPGVQTDLQFNADRKVGRIILSNVNAEDREELWQQYRGIHDIVARYEDKIKK